jgi:predicted NAD/FAD-dependent oxidoreductase
LSRRDRFAVVGAGVAGLACARVLHDAGAAVTVFERDAIPSGRAATLIEAAGPFDHGAQYFTVTEERFLAAVRRWQAAGVVQRWEGRIVAFETGAVVDKTGSADRHVAVPGMRRLGVHLAQDLDVRYSSPVTQLRRATDGWRIDVGAAEGPDAGPFDVVLVAAPSEIAVSLLDGLTALTRLAGTVTWNPCWTATMALAAPSGADFEGAFINDDPILGWVALDSAKPRRGRVDGVAERWVLQAKPHWSQRYTSLTEMEAARWLVRSFSARLRGRPSPL